MNMNQERAEARRHHFADYAEAEWGVCSEVDAAGMMIFPGRDVWLENTPRGEWVAEVEGEWYGLGVDWDAPPQDVARAFTRRFEVAP